MSREAILFPGARELLIRRATEADLPAVVALFGDADGNARDQGRDASDPAYRAALAAMTDDNMLMVAEVDGKVAGVFQLTMIRHVAHHGGLVAQIEAVYVDRARRGNGVGEAMMRWAIHEARRRGCFRVQLTSNKLRKRAHAFYERLGFVASHEGMKLTLD
jgi:GNAT superfamily N-acetyltransferase